MKHTLKITIILLVFFLMAQFIGINILYNSIDFKQTETAGKTVFKDLPIGERPPVDEQTSYVPIIIAIIVGTLLLLLLIKLNWVWVWKIWFLIAVVIALTMAFDAYVAKEIALAIALALGIWKIFKPNFWVQNLTELFVYGGLAVIFVPILNVFSVSVLLVLIALYDAYAVWKSKHMITLAKSQTKAKVFAGLLIPYKLGKEVKKKLKAKVKEKRNKLTRKTAQRKAGKLKVPVKVRTAVLGGGDIGFPLIFAGVILKEMGLWQSLVIPFFALGGLGFLLWYGNEKKFYPAMPFIGAGCFVGLGVVYLIGLLV